MKILSILFGFALIFNINYFNDISLDNTSVIIKGSHPDPLCATPEPITFELEEEEYVNDIPFNTKAIVENPPDFYSFSSLTNYSIKLEDEKYVEDIPFNTNNILNLFKAKQLINCAENHLEINSTEEGYIDDIPFDTKKIIEDINKSKSCNDNP